MISFRSTTLSDLDFFLKVAKQGQDYLKSKGIPQWINGYPGKSDFESDLKKGWGHVICENNKPIGYFAISHEEDPTYKSIYEGSWHSNGLYTVIHRGVIDSQFKGKGYFGKVFEYAAQVSIKNGIYALRCDTHQKNLSMRKCMENSGFQYCGIIYLENGDPRVAYDCILRD